jgi:hypothetical protein
MNISLCDVIGNVLSCIADSSTGDVLHVAYVLTTSAIWRYYQIAFHSLTNQFTQVRFTHHLTTLLVYHKIRRQIVTELTITDLVRMWQEAVLPCYVQLSRNVPKTEKSAKFSFRGKSSVGRDVNPDLLLRAGPRTQLPNVMRVAFQSP